MQEKRKVGMWEEDWGGWGSKMKWKDGRQSSEKSVCQGEQQWLSKRGCYVFICFDFIVLVLETVLSFSSESMDGCSFWLEHSRPMVPITNLPRFTYLHSTPLIQFSFLPPLTLPPPVHHCLPSTTFLTSLKRRTTRLPPTAKLKLAHNLAMERHVVRHNRFGFAVKILNFTPVRAPPLPPPPHSLSSASPFCQPAPFSAAAPPFELRRHWPPIRLPA